MIFATKRQLARTKLSEWPDWLATMVDQWRASGIPDEAIDEKLLMDRGTAWPRMMQICNQCQRNLTDGSCPRHGEQEGLPMFDAVIPVKHCFRWWIKDLMGPITVWRRKWATLGPSKFVDHIRGKRKARRLLHGPRTSVS